MKRMFLLTVCLLFIVAISSYADWGNLPKFIQGDDGGRYLTWTANTMSSTVPIAQGGWGDTRSAMKPNGDGTWSCTLAYSPGYYIPEVTFFAQKTSYDSTTPNAANWEWTNQAFNSNGSAKISLTIPDTATNGTIVMDATTGQGIGYKWNAASYYTDWNYGYTGNLALTPGDGQITVNVKRCRISSGVGQYQIDAADTNSNYGYQVFRADSTLTNFVRIHPDTYIKLGMLGYPDTDIQSGMVSPNSNWYIPSSVPVSGATATEYFGITDTGGYWNGNAMAYDTLINGDTYYYAVIVTDAYDVSGDSYASGSDYVYKKPGAPVWVIFKCMGADPRVIEKNGYKAYLTPIDAQGNAYFFNKIPVTVTPAVLRGRS